ncbi:hypothetical protein CGCA056_v014681 [Colletotrichum aenigma]|uniref:uncharacterized protein n=1 Tax=Colletotrichum aenigma TaxID=1215731 RepID=UPI001872E0F7|nr:uncharacterized protein CGCA056_v014681 [Colletotrichum aenigma]KAF5502768.1 hypothetical protein CGCA056_v014681 [Colletotrichum aenigma]
MAKNFGFLAVLMMAVVPNADKHRLCACVRDQPPAGMIIDDEATKAVVNGSDERFVYSESAIFVGVPILSYSFQKVKLGGTSDSTMLPTMGHT